MKEIKKRTNPQNAKQIIYLMSTSKCKIFGMPKANGTHLQTRANTQKNNFQDYMLSTCEKELLHPMYIVMSRI